MADAWSEAEKSSLLMQIIYQLKPEKGGINWDLVHLEGRTKKACQNNWHKYMAQHKQQMESLGGENGGEAGTQAKAKRNMPVPRKRKPKKEQMKVEGDDDDEDESTPVKKPRGRTRQPKLEDDIDVPQPQTLEEVNKYMNRQTDTRAAVEDSI